jgi:hypothetical protein
MPRQSPPALQATEGDSPRVPLHATLQCVEPRPVPQRGLVRRRLASRRSPHRGPLPQRAASEVALVFDQFPRRIVASASPATRAVHGPHGSLAEPAGPPPARGPNRPARLTRPSRSPSAAPRACAAGCGCSPPRATRRCRTSPGRRCSSISSGTPRPPRIAPYQADQRQHCGRLSGSCDVR